MPRSRIEDLDLRRDKPRDMSRGLSIDWINRPGWQPFGNRLDFLSEERQHLQTGAMVVLSAKPRDKRGA